MITKIKANGFCWVGDPHVCSTKPGTRNDKDFLSTIIGKLNQCVDIANKQNMIMLVAGDLFDINNDTNATMLTRMIRAFNRCQYKAYELLGNSHDKTEITLTDDAALSILKEAGSINVIEQSGFFLIIDLPDGKSIGVGATPHGIDIPNDVRKAREELKVDQVIWLTHHDLAFDGAYPGATELFEIKGCDMVINGHMHLTKNAIVHGQTTWHNPGNILRQSKDTANHVPSVWIGNGSKILTPIVLNYVPKVFDVIINQIAVTPIHLAEVASQFSAMLKGYKENVIETADGSELKAELQIVYEELKVEQPVQLLVNSLHAMAVSEKIN